MAKQITNSIVMVRPIGFCFNTQTAANDFFQNDLGEKHDIVEAKALIEFDGFVGKLRGKGITVHVIQDDAVVCLSSIDDPAERQMVVNELTESGKQIIDASEREIGNFAGNEIELEGSGGKRYTVMTRATLTTLTDGQKAEIEKSSEILASDVETIETYGGGSVRCMISEVS